ncbi:hypothetical protein C9439_00425 [archaeon SCG-AAA382B04]|nr:hypothetical protein C9439_00425 [archaeon SCG-AAA382B04]
MSENDFKYEKIFERNYGIFLEEEQEKIKNGKIAIIGCGGAGGAISLALARSGVQNFVLADPDTYETTNINRQMGCQKDTIGKNKAEVTKKAILGINPSANVETFTDPDPELDEIDKILNKNPDALIAVADDFPFAIIAMRKALKKDIPCVTSYPTGALVRVTVFEPGGPQPEEAFGLPKNLQYKTLENLMFSTKYRKRFKSTLEFYKKEGDWTEEWFEEFVEGKKPFPQIAPFVWIGSSIAALEVIKLLSDKWEPISCPRHWKIKPNEAKIDEFDPPSIKEKLGTVLFKLKEKFSFG